MRVVHVLCVVLRVVLGVVCCVCVCCLCSRCPCCVYVVRVRVCVCVVCVCVCVSVCCVGACVCVCVCLCVCAAKVILVSLCGVVNVVYCMLYIILYVILWLFKWYIYSLEGGDLKCAYRIFIVRISIMSLGSYTKSHNSLIS